MHHYYKNGQESRLDQAIREFERVVDRCPTHHPGRSAALSNLAMAKFISCQAREAHLDLDEPISLFQEALDLRPPHDPDHPCTLINLGIAHLAPLQMRFERQGRVQDLDESIQRGRAMSLSCPNDSEILNNLANALCMRFEQRGDGKDLDEAIEHHRVALQLTPAGHPDRSSSLNNFASALWTRFQQRGDGMDLDEATEHFRVALQLTPAGHPDRSYSLNNLASALWTRSEQRGDGKDLDEAIEHHRVALQLRPAGHPDRSSSLNNLASALSTRFEQRGDGKDLDEAIEHFRVALQLTPTGHPLRSVSLNNLASALWTRFEQRGDGKDLDEAIEHYRVALQLRPAGHPDRSSSLNNLASALYTRFKQRGDGKDLDEAIEHFPVALQLTPAGDGKDLDEAIEHFRVALQLRPTGHPDRSSSLNNLASALFMQFERQGDGKGLDEAIQLSSTAAEQSLARPTHLHAQLNLAEMSLALWRSQHTTQVLDDAMDHYRAAAQYAPAGLLRRLQSSLQWVKDAEDHQHTSALDAYAQSLQLLDSHISATASVSSRHQARKHFPPDLSVNAASCALRQGDVCRAVEFLEQGRAPHWAQIARFRTPLDDLRSRDPCAKVLVKRFRDLSAMLNRPAQTSFDEGRSITTVEAEAQHYRDLVEEWNKVVEEIRTFEGFSRFLLPPLFADLREAAREGPIIILIASKFSRDAIIVLHRRSPVHLRLQITSEEIRDLVMNHLQNIRYVHRDGDYQTPEEVMGELWKKVIHPVVRELKKYVRKDSRIWWCPTSLFTALPLHSAGEYERGSQVLSKLFVSSYTPSLLALNKARTYPKTTSDINFTAISQAKPLFAGASWTPLHYVDPEVDEVEKLLPTPPVLFTKLTSSESTKKQVLHTLQGHQWFHLSCHGKQDLKEPFKSHFAMQDGPLSVLDIIDADISRHEFAFLSACETAMGDLSAPDQVIHLAAGLQFMGVKSVIGTLWSVGDKVAYRLVSAFYKEFCKDGTMDCTTAARALHKAVATLAEDNVPLEARAMFIHIGI
ncbi:hypothetical protein HYDPIDRAFT_136260 [Hydnomerulius pinastri MD-312]|uniref:CHAT domain-containing protein n=1 Tax=Hydnomerulius pinastri MD-312 TaxID=994086 RepID=A0A0C9WCJ5_9AGAM|nr:hypothetical protein HYDPIDRAFT_136260 [Hydnomerulius pinastri MD-312]